MAGVTSLWPWLAIAGIGALHGLNPASGWALAAAWGLRSRNRAQALRALLPIAAGHAASVLLVAAVVAAAAGSGLPLGTAALQAVAGALLAVVLMHHWRRRKTQRSAPRTANNAGLALCSFIMSTAHGAGLMLVPALVPLCMGEGAVREITASGSLAPGLAAVAVHMTAMLAVTGVMAVGACGATAGLAARWFNAGGTRQPPAH